MMESQRHPQLIPYAMGLSVVTAMPDSDYRDQHTLSVGKHQRGVIVFVST